MKVLQITQGGRSLRNKIAMSQNNYIQSFLPGLDKGKDVFFSQNTFYKPQRKIENIRQRRSLYVEINCHNLNYDPHGSRKA
jgi:hypothetical protein